MPRLCSICTHEQRAELEQSLATGRSSFRAIARQFGVSSDAVRRHVRAHLDEQVGDDLLALNGAQAVDFATRMLDIADSAREVRQEADDSGNGRLALAAGRAEAEVLETLADRLGVRHDDLVVHAKEFADAWAAFRALAPTRPDVVEAMADELEKQGRTSDAFSFRRAAESYRKTKAVSA